MVGRNHIIATIMTRFFLLNDTIIRLLRNTQGGTRVSTGIVTRLLHRIMI